MTGTTDLPIEPNFFERCITITEKYEKIWGRWHSDSQFLHIITEVCETKDVVRNKNEKYGKYASPEFKEKLLDEMADIYLTTMATYGYFGITTKDINLAILKKLMEVEKRVEENEKEAKEFAKDMLSKTSSKNDINEVKQKVMK